MACWTPRCLRTSLYACPHTCHAQAADVEMSNELREAVQRIRKDYLNKTWVARRGVAWRGMAWRCVRGVWCVVCVRVCVRKDYPNKTCVCIDMRTDLRVDMHADRDTDMCTDIYLFSYGQRYKHVYRHVHGRV